MICPKCGAMCRRSRRRKAADYVLTLAGMRPWRCRKCEARFHAWSVAPRYVARAHCARCGNLDLQQIGREYVTEGPLRWLWRLLHVPAYRCQPCRYCFFSLRPYRRIASMPTAPEPPEDRTSSARPA